MLLSNSTQFLFLNFVYMYTLQFTTETNSPLRNLPFLILLRSCPRSPPMRSTMAQSLTTLGDGTDWCQTTLEESQPVAEPHHSQAQTVDSDWLLGHLSFPFSFLGGGICEMRDRREDCTVQPVDLFVVCICCQPTALANLTVTHKFNQARPVFLHFENPSSQNTKRKTLMSKRALIH